MTIRRLAASLVVGGGFGLVAALPAAAKEGVTATLESAVPVDAAAGTRLTVSWTLSARDEDGTRRPFSALPVFVRLLSKTGAGAKVAFASSAADDDGRYAASVVVPDGGIRDVQIGLRGFTSGANGTHNADVLFPIANDPLPGVAGVVTPAGRNWTPWIVGVALGIVLLVLTSGAFAALRRPKRGMAIRG
jgi:hypothetical protein